MAGTPDLAGPARFACGFKIKAGDNQMDLTGSDIRFMIDQLDYRPKVFKTRRVGVDYARRWKNRPLRSIDMNNPVAKRLGI